MRYLRVLPLAGILLLHSAAAGAGEVLTPSRAVDMALAGHPSARVADREVDAARAGKSLARTGWIPRVFLSEEIMRSTNPVFVFGSKLGQERFGPADFAIESLNEPDALTNAATRLTLEQNIWDAGRTRLHSLVADLGVEAATSRRVRAREEIAFGALQAFWDAVLAAEMHEVALAAESAASANVDATRERVDAGLAVPSDRMQAEVRLAGVRAGRIQAEEGILVSRAALREALGLNREADFDLMAPPAEVPPAEESVDSRVAEALAARPDYRALDLAVEQAVLAEKIAGSRRLPEIGLGAQYEWNSESLLGSDGSNWAVGASVRVPIFDGLETRARKEQARAERAALEARRDSLAERIRLEVRSTWAQRRAAAGRLETAESALAQAEEALRIVRERYEEGLAVVVELLGAEAARTQAQASRAGAARDLALAQAALDLASARLLSPESSGGPDDPSTR
jgi:outer membrane protein